MNEKQMKLDGFGVTEERPVQPVQPVQAVQAVQPSSPYIDDHGVVKFACWRPLKCRYRRHSGDSLTCVYYVGLCCTHADARRLTLKQHIQAYQKALQALEVENE